MSQTYYKLRHKQTKLYSPGGVWGVYNKHGKLWANLGTIKSHITSCVDCNRYGIDAIENLEVVEVQLTEIKTTPVLDYIDILKVLKK